MSSPRPLRLSGVTNLTEVADGVWVRQSEWMWTNSIVVRGDDGLIVVDPGITGAELAALADDVAALGIPVVAGFSTHPHWDHLLWHPGLGDVPRYATAANAELASVARERAQAMAAETAPDVPLDLVAVLTPLPDGDGPSPIPGELAEHHAHAIGHAAILLADRGVLLAGDMLSDVLIPLFDPRQEDQLSAYEQALDRLTPLVARATVAIPGHGSVATTNADITARLDADKSYINALREGTEPTDPRLGPHAAWLDGPHRSNMERAASS
jgi:glyoxylase-like metal-dependent hydrolase (beta-lactamase superfamily II)